MEMGKLVNCCGCASCAVMFGEAQNVEDISRVCSEYALLIYNLTNVL